MILREVRRLRAAFGYSCDGLSAAWREDAPFRLEMLLSVVLLPLALWLGDNGLTRAVLAGSWLLVPIIELLNCGLEALTDYATQGARHVLAKKTKDVGSAAVLLAILNFLLVWGCLLF